MTLYAVIALGSFFWLSAVGGRGNPVGSLLGAAVWPVLCILYPWLWFKREALGLAPLEGGPRGEGIFELELCVSMLLACPVLWTMAQPGSVMLTRLW